MAEFSTTTVELGDRSYPIVIGSTLLGGHFELTDYVDGPDCLIVSNEKVAPHYLDALRENLGDRQIRQLVLADGEAYKTLQSAATVIDALVDARANRDTTVLALGGGVVGDIAGFAAACYMRGVNFIQVPTTLLAQVDSSVGGKTGVNHAQGKNLIGAFHQPRLVLIDTDTLRTLPERELKAGLAEVIKHGVIADAEYFAWLERNLDGLLQGEPDLLANAIRRSCEIKAAVVAADEREHGRRALLNFGHTFGHAIENSLGYGEWLHGEAVAAGMVMAAAVSQLPPTERQRLRDLLARAGLPVEPPGVGAERLAAAMRLDKKVKAKEVRLVLLKRLGEAYLTSDYPAATLRQVLAAADAA